MNTQRIYGEIIKAYCAGKRIYIGEYEGSIAISLNGYCMYLLHKATIPFDVKKLLGDNTPITVKGLIPQKRERAQLADELIQRERKIYRKVASQSTEAWVEQKLLSNFDGSATFEVSTPRSNILVLENDMVVGIVTPYLAQQ